MAIVALPYGSVRPGRALFDATRPEIVRPAAPRDDATTRRISFRARRRGLGFVSTAVILAATWFASSVIAPHSSSHLSVLAHSTPTAGGYLYTVQPGDTLWSISSELVPSGDPRTIMDSLVARLGGSVVRPGEKILVP